MKPHTPTYSSILREELDGLDIEPSQENFRRLLNILSNALGELARHERRIEQLSANASVASCLANGIQPD